MDKPNKVDDSSHDATEPHKTQESKNETNNESIPSSASMSFNALGSTASSWFNQGSTWGSSFLNSAKEKTMTTLEFVKKDLNDLSEAVSSEVTDLASAAKEGFGTAANAVKQQAQALEKLVTPTEEEASIPGEVQERIDNDENNDQKKKKEMNIGFGWMTKIVDSVTDTVKNLAMEETTNEEENYTETIQPKQIRKTCLPQEKLLSIQKDRATFTTEPESSEFYDRWLAKFRLEEYDGEINMLLSNNPALREIFAKLVPSTVAHDDFWRRYFFAIEYAEIEEEMNKSTLSEALEIDTSPKKTKKVSKASSQSTDTSVVVNEPTSPSQSDWSVCSEKNVEEITSNEDEEETEKDKGPLTPKPKDDSNKTKEDGWVEWDE